MQSQVTVKLTFPVTVEAHTYNELKVRRVKVRDRRAAMKVGGTDADKEIRLFSILCEVPESVIEELDDADYVKLQEAYTSFRTA